jgi:hypothetical protein
MSSLPECKPFAAVGALEWFLACVDPLVLPEVGQLVEFLVTMLARVLLRAGVRALVLVHVTHLFELLVTVGALVGILPGVHLPLVGASEVEGKTQS